MFASFLAGLVASLTPCVVVLFPIVFYRFFHEEHKEWKSFSLFVVGFLASFLVFGFIFQGLLTSGLENGIRLGLGIIFLGLGILALLNKINPMNFPLIKNTFLLGASFALILSFSPCTIPYLGVLISLGSQTEIIINILMFGLGLIVPAFAFAFFGKRMIEFIAKKGEIFEKINKLMSLVLILSGAYMAISITAFAHKDTYVVGLMLLLLFAIVLKAFFVINSKKDLVKVKNILLLIALIGIIFATIIHCNHFVSDYAHLDNDNISCSLNPGTCEVCQQCAMIFGVATLIGIVAIALSKKKFRIVDK